MTCLYPRRILVPAMFFIALASLFLTVDTVPAAVVWDGGSLVDSSLVTPENWVGDSLPLTTDDVQFDGSVRLDPFTSGAVTYNSLAFNATAGAFTIGGTDTISLTATSSTLVNNSELLQTLSAPVSFAAKAYVRATAGDLDLGNVTLGTSTLSFYGKNHTTTVNGTITGTTGVTATDGTTLVLDANSAATWTNGALTLDNTSNSTTPTVVRLTASGAAGAASSSTSNYIMINGASDKSATLELSGGITIDKWIRCQHRTGAMADVAHIRNIGDNTLQGRIYNRTGGAYVNIDSDSGLLTIASAIEQPESGARSIRFRGEGDIKLTGTLTGVGTAGQSWKVSKIGSGTLTYDSAGINYLGNTGVFGGTLTLTSTGANALANSPVIWIDSGASLNVSAAGLTLSGTQTLQGHGTVTGNLATSSGSTLIPGGTADDGLSTFTDTPGTLSVSGNLTLASGAVMPWDLSDVIDNVNNGINDRIDVGGNLALDGGTINVNLLSGALAEGDYRLFNAGTISGTVGNLTLNVEGGADTRINTTLTQNLQEVNLHVVGTPLELTWQGNSTNNNWDLHTTADWDGGEMFYNLDSVTFNDTGSNSPDINLVGDLCPANITVEETKDYVFAGSGSLEGNIAVTKTGTGKLTLANTGLNEFTGTVALSGGTLAVNRVDDWTLAASLAGTATLEQAGAGTLRLSGSNSGFTGPVVISGGTLSLDAAADMDLSAGMPDITDNANLQLGGTSNFTVGRKITGTGGLEKVDANIVYLTADNDYQGATTITGGTLQVGTSATRTGTPGSGAIVNNGLLILNSDQVYEIAGDISGSGGLRFGFDAANSQLPNAAVTLSGDNSFDGAVNIYQGTVIATSSTAFGSTVGSTRVISQNSQQDNGRLELDGSGGNLEIAESFTTTGSGGTAFRYDGPGIIRNVAGDNKITGSIGMTGGGGSSLVKVAAGTLELAGAISNAYNNSLRYIVLGGESGTGGTVSGSITDGSTNAYTGVKKVDSNTWTFTGNNSYTGPTCIYGGTLALGEVPDGYGGVLSTGSIASSPAVILYNDSATLQVTGLTNPTFTVPSTMWLVGNGTVAGNVESSYGTISPSGPVNPSAGVTTDTNLPIGTLNVGGNLKLSGYDYLQFKLGGTGGTQIDQIQVTNTLQTDEYFSSPSYVSIVPSGPVTPGTYTLISAASQSGLGTFELDPYHPHNTRYGLTLDNATAGQVKVTVTGSNDTMVWSGPSGGTWDVVTSANWTGPTDYLFWQGDAVQFTGETEDMEIVVGDAYYNSVLYPASILVSSSKNYTFSGDGKISSGASLVKSGAGTLTIANTGANDFTGTVTITGGTLVVENEYSLGSTVGGTVVDGGTLDFNGRSIRQEPITVRGGGAVVNNNDGHVESLYYVTLTGPAVFGGVEDWFINGENPLNIWEDTFLHGNGNALTKTGTNEVELANIGATNLGDINVTEGTLTVSGNTNLGASAITLSGGAVLKLSDATETVEKTLNVDSTGGVINNASGDGTIAGSGGTLSGLLTVQTAAGTTLELDNALEGTGGLTKENAGTLILGGANAYSGDTTISAGVLELVTGGQIDPDSLIVNHAALEVTSGSHTAGVIEGEGTTTVFGSATLTAASVTQGTLIIGGVSGGGAAATAAPVPEPGVWVLLLAGLLGIGIRRQCAHR